MNREVTSKEAILQVCRKIAAEQGLSALSTRAVAQACGIALGTLYHYYSDKDALLLATVESVWQDIFHRDDAQRGVLPFPESVTALFHRVRSGTAAYPGFLAAHSIAIAGSRKGEAKDAMERCFAHMKTELLGVLRADPQVDREAFSGALTQASFVDFVVDSLLLLLVKEAPDCEALTTLVRRVIYR
ncbi:MAG: TetR/AcrR family transcriptional regulator [Firmicutes bacterium]|nr:TetR/AcrR family transcriptional regulator [Bacillota bacterium]